MWSVQLFGSVKYAHVRLRITAMKMCCETY